VTGGKVGGVRSIDETLSPNGVFTSQYLAACWPTASRVGSDSGVVVQVPAREVKACSLDISPRTTFAAKASARLSRTISAEAQTGTALLVTAEGEDLVGWYRCEPLAQVSFRRLRGDDSIQDMLM